LLPHQEHFINPFIISGISQILFPIILAVMETDSTSLFTFLVK